MTDLLTLVERVVVVISQKTFAINGGRTGSKHVRIGSLEGGVNRDAISVKNVGLG